MKKRILITAGAGFIGFNFLKQSKRLDNYDVTAIYRKTPPLLGPKIKLIKADLNNLDDCRSYLVNYDVIIHCAGVMMTSAKTKINPIEGLMDNFKMHLNIIDVLKDRPPAKLIWLSSTTGYPESDDFLTEDQYFKGEVPKRYETIGYLYRFMEKIIQKIMSDKCNLVTLRPTGVFGEKDDFRPESSHILPKIIRDASLNLLSRTIYAQKEEMRNWIYIGDLIKAIDSVLENVDFSITLNIGGVESTSMYELYQVILEILGIEKKHNINSSNPFSGKPLSRNIDCNLSTKYLGKYNSTSLKSGLRKTIRWYQYESSK